jgi:hypothetical protein
MFNNNMCKKENKQIQEIQDINNIKNEDNINFFPTDILEFINKNEIPYELIIVNVLEKWNYETQKNYIEKEPYGITQGITDIDVLIKKFKNKYYKNSKICYKINLFNSNLSVFDIDDDSSLEQIYYEYPELKDTLYLPGNTKGFHFYIKNEKLIKAKKICCKMNVNKKIKGDLITDFIWEDINKKIVNFNQINYIEEKDIINAFPTFKSFEDVEKEKEEKNVLSFNVNTSIPNNIGTAIFLGNKNELEEIVNNIPKRYADNYEDWIKIISILKKYNFYDYAKLFSKKSKKYNEQNFENYYLNKTIKWEHDIGTLFHYSKENKTNFNKIKAKYLKNDIKKDNDFSYKTVVDKFEKTHFKVVNKSLYGKYENNKLLTFTKKTLCEAYSHMYYEVKKINKDGEEEVEDKSFITKYTGVNKAIKLYEDMNVYPNNEFCPKNHFNLWFPFELSLIKEYEEDKKGLEFVLNHVKMLCKYEESVYEYILDYMAHMFQFPHEKSDIFVLFVGLQGSGKSMLVELLGNMVGSEKYLETSNPARDVWGNHNSPMTNTYLVNFEELDFLQTKGSEGIFKNIITGKTIIINPKGKDQFIINSYHRFIGSTNNHDCPIRTSDDDRRNLIINVSNEKKNNKEYFSKFSSLINSKNLQKTFYNFLMDRKDIDIFKSKTIPHTEYQNELKESFEDIILTFIKKTVYKKREMYIDTFNIDDEGYYKIKESFEVYKSSILFDKLNDFLEKEKSKCDFTHKRFSLKIMNLGLKGISKKRNNTGVTFNFDFKVLCEELNLKFKPEKCLINSDIDE